MLGQMHSVDPVEHYRDAINTILLKTLVKDGKLDICGLKHKDIDYILFMFRTYQKLLKERLGVIE